MERSRGARRGKNRTGGAAQPSGRARVGVGQLVLDLDHASGAVRFEDMAAVESCADCGTKVDMDSEGETR